MVCINDPGENTSFVTHNVNKSEFVLMENKIKSSLRTNPTQIGISLIHPQKSLEVNSSKKILGLSLGQARNFFMITHSF